MSILNLAVLCILVALSSCTYSQGATPGIQIRLVKSVINQIKDDVLDLFPLSLEYDINLQEEFKYDVNLLVSNTTLTVNNIQYDLIMIDAKNLVIDFVIYEYQPVIKIYMPLLKKWHLTADYEWTWAFPFPQKAQISFEVDGIMFETAMSLYAPNGYIDPLVNYIDIKFGKTDLDVDEPITNWIGNQIIDIAKVIVESGINLFGWPWVSVGAGPILNEVLQKYQLTIPVDVPILDKKANITSDLRATQDPVLTTNHLDIFTYAEITGNGKTCPLPDSEKHDFVNREDMLQFMITERTVNCAILAIINTEFSYIRLNKENFGNYFNMSSINVDVSTVSQFIPTFEERYEPDAPLDIDIRLEKGTVTYDNPNSQIDIYFSIEITIYLAGEKTIQMQGSFDNIIALDLDLSDEIFKAQVKKWFIPNKSFDQINNNQIGMRRKDFDELIVSLDFLFAFIMRYLNTIVLNNGVALPLHLVDFKSYFMYERDAIFFLLNIKLDEGFTIEKYVERLLNGQWADEEE